MGLFKTDLERDLAKLAKQENPPRIVTMSLAEKASEYGLPYSLDERHLDRIISRVQEEAVTTNTVFHLGLRDMYGDRHVITVAPPPEKKKKHNKHRHREEEER